MFEKVTNSQSSPVTPALPPAKVGNEYGDQTATIQLKNAEEAKRVENILASSTLSTVASGVKPKLNSQEINTSCKTLLRSQNCYHLLPIIRQLGSLPQKNAIALSYSPQNSKPYLAKNPNTSTPKKFMSKIAHKAKGFRH